MQLRDYQQKAVDGVFSSWNHATSALVVLPTGCGKTIVFASVIHRLLNAPPDRSPTPQVLVLAHREELIWQAQQKIAAVTGADVGIEMADLRISPFLGRLPPVVISTVQTMNAGKGHRRMEKFRPEEFAAVIIDEAHHATSPSYRRIVDWFTTRNPSCKVLGVTATPDRKDEAALGQIFNSVAFEYGVRDAIDDGWLVPVRQKLVTVESLDYSHISTSGDDLNQAELAAVMEEEENLQRIAAPTLEIVRQRRAIVFAASVRQAERLAEILNRSATEKIADWICGETPKVIRREKLASFKSGRTRFMVNVGVLTEGFDDAGVDVIVMARPTKSRALYAQMAGRATRPAADIAARLGETDAAGRRTLIAESTKPSCLIVDFVGNSGRHKLVTSTDILGGRYDDETTARAKRKLREKSEAGEEADVSEALEEAQREIAAEKEEIERKRRSVIAVAKYVQCNVNPFDRFDLVEIAEPDPTMVISPDESFRIRKYLGARKYNKSSLGARQALAREMRRRRRQGVATLGQVKFLMSRGFLAPLRVEEASRMISRLQMKEGWGWRR